MYQQDKRRNVVLQRKKAAKIIIRWRSIFCPVILAIIFSLSFSRGRWVRDWRMCQSMKFWSKDTSLMRPPPKIENCKNFCQCLAREKLTDIWIRSSATRPLNSQFQIDSIDRPTNPLFSYVTYTANDLKMAILTEKGSHFSIHWFYCVHCLLRGRSSGECL